MTESDSETDADSTVVSGSKNSDTPNYDSVDIPSKPPTEYNTDERRAGLLQQVRDLGHPSMIHQGEAADRYGVSQQQISKDLDKLADHLDESLGERRALVSEAVYHRAIKGLIENEEWRKAAQTVSEWNDWVSDYQHEQAVDERLDALEESMGIGGDR